MLYVIKHMLMTGNNFIPIMIWDLKKKKIQKLVVTHILR